MGPLVARSWLIPMWGHYGGTWSDWLLGPASFGLVTNRVHPFRDAFHCDLPNARVVWMSVTCTPSQGDHDNGYPPSFLLSQMGNRRLKGRCPKDGNYWWISISTSVIGTPDEMCYNGLQGMSHFHTNLGLKGPYGIFCICFLVRFWVWSKWPPGLF